MKLFTKTFLALAAGSMVSMGAQAAVTYGNGMFTEPYIGAKIGQYDPERADDAALSYGIYGGTKLTPNFGIEAEYLTTSEETAEQTSTFKGDYEGQVYGLYATYVYPFPNANGIYAKGRLGYAQNDFDLTIKSKTAAPNRELNYKDSGVAGGVGIGYDISPNAAVEVAYDWYPSLEGDNNVDDFDVSGITLGAKFKF